MIFCVTISNNCTGLTDTQTLHALRLLSNIANANAALVIINLIHT